ncbi:MAG: hypothetical protein A2017_13490 [Lentisphaerae bacterium GWF2_44_16]|nr:MAG: hypothetical protein A2017_13490 [Lentisphaerae bacterium GWF2_44_16]
MNLKLNEKSILKDFISWVKIDSPSGEEEKISREIIKRLKKAGCSVEADKIGNIKATLKASRGNEKIPFKLFSAHIDTVEPGRGIKPVVLKNGLIRSDGRTILGADDKDGLTAIIQALEYVVKNKIPHGAIELLLSVCEERATEGSRQIKKGWLKSKCGWIFDGPGPIGSIHHSAVGSAEFNIEITGKAAHAGACPELGINALKTAANAIARIQLGRLADNHTVNIGIFKSGVAKNIVPPNAEITGEARSTVVGKINESISLIEKIFAEECKKTGAKFSFKHMISYYPYKLKSNSELIRYTSSILRNAGFTPEVKGIKAGTDANNLNRLGMEVLVLSTGRNKNHSVEEETNISNIIAMSKLAIELMKA